MSIVADAISALREALKMSDDVRRVGDTLKELSKEVREHDRRILVLETQWSTAMAFNRPTHDRSSDSAPRRIERKK